MINALTHLLEMMNNNQFILTAQELHKDIPTIHNFAGKYHSSVNHLGYGYFTGNTEHGKFDFTGGGTMGRRDIYKDGNVVGSISFSPLIANDEVLVDLGYDSKKVKSALAELIEKEIYNG